MQIANADSWKVQPLGKASVATRTFDGDLTIPFHAIRQSLKYALICWHASKSSPEVMNRLQEEATDFWKIYSLSKPLHRLSDEFEMHLAMAVALTNELDLAATLRTKFSFEPCSNGYAYYVGFKQAILGLMLADDDLQREARKHLSKFHATKTFYYPATAVMLAALEGDMKKLKTTVRTISRKFDGYAQKCSALSGETIDVARLDMHWFSPYPDWAFYTQAIRRFGCMQAEDTFWMPMTFLDSFAHA